MSSENTAHSLFNQSDNNFDSFSDEKLIEVILDGHLNEFKIIINRYEKPLFRYISRMVDLEETEKEDLLQEVFIKIYKYLNSFDTSLKFSNWIYRITHNFVIDYIRKVERGKKYKFFLEGEDYGAFMETIKSEVNIEEDLINKEKEIKVKEILETLPDKYKDVLILKFFEDKDYRDISQILKIPEGTVATNLNKAKALFREKAIYYKLNDY